MIDVQDEIRKNVARIEVLCFFFQAEDGIRDLTVTGVQTCALPICLPIFTTTSAGNQNARGVVVVEEDFSRAARDGFARRLTPEEEERRQGFSGSHKIGRASCRERV